MALREMKFSRLLPWVHKTWVRQVVIGLLVLTGLSVILLAGPQGFDLEEGTVARRDIEAPREVVNRPLLVEWQAEAEREAIAVASADPANYIIDPSVAQRAVNKVHELVGIVEQSAYRREAQEGRAPTQAEIRLVQTTINGRMGLELTQAEVRSLMMADSKELDQLGVAVEGVLQRVLGRQRIEGDQVDQAAEAVVSELHEIRLPTPLEEPATTIALGFLRPNLALDQARVDQAVRRAVREIEANPPRIVRGEFVVRKGQVITAEQMTIMRDLGLLGRSPWVTGGMFLTIFGLMALMIVYLYYFNREILEGQRSLSLLGLILVVAAGLAQLTTIASTWAPVIPMATITMLAAILLESRLGIILSVAMAFMVGAVSGGDYGLVSMALAGGTVGVFAVSKLSQRGDLMRAGFIVGLANVAMLFSVGMSIGRDPLWLSWIVLGMVNGIFAAVLTIGSLPYLESIFGITSSIRLLELSNPNNPLLKRLLTQAPGTYHHSIMVGNLAEAAADAIGADGLLARVGAYYHDVGKIKRPFFFVENQMGHENPHDKIAPSLSTLIITSHAKDGVELAREYRLPETLVDFIRSHHGTSLVRFFYHKANEKSKEDVKEDEYRYSGPRPHTQELAIVMLADSVEAAVRSLSRPTPGRIEGLVRKIVKDRLNDGELDDSDLTLQDLQQVSGAFSRVLSGIFHSRVEYPDGSIGNPLQEKEEDED